MRAGKKVKVVLIGAGGWGYQHARAFSSHSDVDFCAIVGRSPDKTRRRAEEFGVRFYLDIDEMLDQEQPDLVSICLPNQGHFETTLRVIRAGYPLFVEKPLVFDLEEADILLHEASERDLFFGFNFNHRYAKPVQMAYQDIKKGKLGELVFATWRFGGEGDSDHPYANLIETQCHGFDMLEHLCGPIESIMAEMTDQTKKGFSTMVLSLKFVNGAIGSLVGSYDTSYAYSDAHRVEINGTEGRILIQDTVGQYQFQYANDETSKVWQAGYFNDIDREFHRTFDKHIDDMLDAFKKGEKPPINAREGYRALILAYAAIESFSTGKRVRINN